MTVSADEFGALDLHAVAALLREREVTSSALVESSLRRARGLHKKLNCFIELREDEALRQAEVADTEIRQGQYRGSLHGIPLAEKDMFFTPGRVSSMGSGLGHGFAPKTRATVLDRLQVAGAVSLGTLNMSEFAAGPTGQNEFFGTCRNPWNTDYIAGGSSSGSACAVAARLIYGSVGSDTGGSIRLPSAMCGVVGIKPTHGVVSRHGAMPRCWSLDVIGPIARTAMDCALVLSTLAGRDDADSATYHAFPPVRPDAIAGHPGPVRIGFAQLPAVESEVERALGEAAAAFAQLGFVVERIPLPDTAGIYALTQIVNKAEAAALHARPIMESPEGYGLSARSRIEAGFHIPAPYYLAAIAARSRVLKQFAQQVFSKVDVVLLPVIPRAVPSIDEVAMKASGDIPGIVDHVTQCTRWVSYLGLPAVTAPCGRSRNGLPIGLQLLARPYAEQQLLSLLHWYQGVTSWHRDAPRLAGP